MEISDFLEKLDIFLSESSSFARIAFDGCYQMNRGTFIEAFNHYLRTGENVLDDYSELVDLSWFDIENGMGTEYFDEKKRIEIKKLLNGRGFWNPDSIISESAMNDVLWVMRNSEALDRKKSTYEWRRKEANKYTVDPEIRSAVFEKHGEVCVECGSIDNITLDHIIPVVKGGEDSIENLQPLCVSCNSKKGSSL